MMRWSVAVLDCSSSGVPFSGLSEIAGALREQVERDFAPVWGVAAEVVACPEAADAPEGAWRLCVVDEVPGGGGVHLDEHGMPYAEVANADGLSIALSHELLEMLADPWGNRFTIASSADPTDPPHQVFCLVEVCDPCETTSYVIDGVAVSDFVFPGYYDMSTTGRVDFVGALDGPLRVPPGCYLSWVDPLDGRWHQRLPDGTVVTADYVDGGNARAARDAALSEVCGPRHVAISVDRAERVRRHGRPRDHRTAASPRGSVKLAAEETQVMEVDMTGGSTAPTIPWHATAQVSRVLVDFMEVVTYRQGRFFKSSRVVTGPPGPEVELGTTEMKALLAELNDEREEAPPGVDVRALQAFIDLLSGVLS